MASYTSSNDPFWDIESRLRETEMGLKEIKSRRNYSKDTLEVSIPAELMARMSNTEDVLSVMQNQILDQMAMSQKQMYQSQQQNIQSYSSPQTHFLVGGGGGGGAGMAGSAGASRDTIVPMGISQWAEHGKKYGYWDYFKEQVFKEFQALQRQNPLHTTGVHQMVFGGSMVGRMRPGEVMPVPDKVEIPKNKVSITPDITVADKIQIKKHVVIK